MFQAKIISVALAGVATLTVAAPASAQDRSGPADFYVGVQGGYQSFDFGADADLANQDDSGVYGVYAGIETKASPAIVLGIEANYAVGDGIIDSEYGAYGKIGVLIGERGQLFARAGYQEINLDVAKLFDVTVPGIDDTDGDYALGVGAQYKVANNVSVRATLDTISFDTTRIAAGLAFHF